MNERYHYTEFEQKRLINNVNIVLPIKPDYGSILLGGQIRRVGFSTIQAEVRQSLKEYPQWTSEQKNSFEKREWDRRRNGVWFYNNSFLEYVTGQHYFYLCYWMIPIEEGGRKFLGLPRWVDSDRDHFYFWKHCEDAPDCYGMMEITNRRDGKSFRSLCKLYETISRSEEAKGGMQSKNNRDGKDLFMKLIKSWQKLPPFFKPIDTGLSHPKSSLVFDEPGMVFKKTQEKKHTRVLRSEIDYGTAKDEEYDGEGLLRYFGDEIGKTDTSEADIYKRWYIVKETLADGTTITGKAMLTTTVEEITKENVVKCKNLWYESDPQKKTALNQTESGLYKYFKPAFYGLRGTDLDKKPFIDGFGYSNIELAKKYLEQRRETKKSINLNAEKRKYPFEEHESFIIDNQMSPFCTENIYQQLDFNTGLAPSTVIRGNIIWIEKDQKAQFFSDDSKGRWLIVIRPPKQNNFHLINSKIAPGNTDIVCGIDPFDHKTTTDGRHSKGSSHVRLKFNPLDPYNSKIFIAHYLARPPLPEQFYEDMIIQCFFYGCQAFIENNKIGILNFFRMRGYENYLMKRKETTHTDYSKKFQREAGIPMTGEDARNALIDALVTEVYTNVGYIESEQRQAKMYFNETLMDWAEFEPDNWTPYDSTVSSGLALLAEKNSIVVPKRKIIPNFVKQYRNVGVKSQLIKPEHVRN